MDLLDKAKNYVAGKVADMPKPEANVDDVDFKSISRECITYRADVSVKNPYSVSIPICEISYVLKSAGRYLNPSNLCDCEPDFVFDSFLRQSE